MARLTGLEPATPGVTGRYSNQLSYNRPLPPGFPSVRGGVWKARRIVKRLCAKIPPPHRSGKGMNSASSPGGKLKRPCAQSPSRQASFAASIRSFEEATKFHQI